MKSIFRLKCAVVLGPVLLVATFSGCGGDPTGDPVRFSVTSGSGLSAVADTLGARDIVDWTTGFKLYGRLSGDARSIKAGVYEIRRGTAWSEIIDKLVSGDL